jgi:hypothetical protein
MEGEARCTAVEIGGRRSTKTSRPPEGCVTQVRLHTLEQIRHGALISVAVSVGLGVRRWEGGLPCRF